MIKTIDTKENYVEQYLDGYDFEAETFLMAYEDSANIYESEDLLLRDDGENFVVLSFVKRGLSIKLSYYEWEQLRDLLKTGENPEDINRASDVQISDFGQDGCSLYFPSNNLNLLLRRYEFERLKNMVLHLGSPYPWGVKPQFATA